MRKRKQRLIWLLLLSACLAMAVSPPSLLAAPFAKFFQFTQPDNQGITLRGEGDDFYAVFETTTGYTVIFDPLKKGYFYATLSADRKSLVSTGVFAHLPPPPALKKHIRIDRDAAAAIATKNRKKWDEATGLSQRWSRLKSKNLGTPSPEKAGVTPAPPPTKTTGDIVGLTLLIDFPDAPATMSKSDIEAFLNGQTYNGFGNNGSVWKYFSDVSNGKLNYTNVVTIYIRMNQPKSYYNNTDTDFNCGDQGRLLIGDALAIMKARSDYNDTILPTFNSLTTDQWGTVLGFNVFFAGGTSGVWSRGLWPHSSSLFGAVDLGNGKNVSRYQMTNVGDSLELGTFCHENGHMLCSFPDFYDYGYDSSGGAGVFSLMGYGCFGPNPEQVDAYLKTAAGWATAIDVDASSGLAGTLIAAPDPGFNTFYRFRRPGVATEYFLFENRQNTGRDAGLPAAGIAAWHVDELGNRDDQNTTPNPYHSNYELTLVQADNLWHFESYTNYGDSWDLYFQGNTSAGYTNRLDDTSSPSANWWDGSPSGLNANSFSAPGMSMTLNFTGTTYTFCGTVRDGGPTGPVIPGATVSMGGKTAITSSAGTFCITDLPAGTYVLTISKTGYIPLTEPFLLNSNMSDDALYLVAEPSYTLSGTVRQGSATGPALPGATVSIAGKSAVTSSTGYFRITGIPAGSYDLIIAKSGFITKSISYAINSDKSGAVFYLTPNPTYTLSGTVRQASATGPVLPGAMVSIAGKTATTSSTGYFRVSGIPAGTYMLTISKAGYITRTIKGYVVNGNKSGVLFYLTVAPTYTLSGTVRQGSATGPALAGAIVSIAGKSTTTSSTGYFRLAGIPAGTYTLTISKAGYITKKITGYVSSNKSGLAFYLTVAPTYSISGTVRKGSTSGPVLAGATVSIAGKSTTTSSTGYFRLAGIPAGTYTLTISKAGYTTRTTTGYVVNSNKSGLVFYLVSTYADMRQRGNGTRPRVTLSS